MRTLISAGLILLRIFAVERRGRIHKTVIASFDVAPMGTCRPLVARPGFLSRHSAVSEISCHTPLCTHIRESRTDCPIYFAIDALCLAPSPRKHLCAIIHQTAMPARSPVLSQASFPSMSRFTADPRGD